MYIMILECLTLFGSFLTPSRIIFLHFSFMFIFFFKFFIYIYLFLFSYNCLHFLHFPIPYLFTVRCLHEISLGGNTDTTVNCKCYKSKIFQVCRTRCEIPPHNYDHPKIFKTCSLLHFLSVVFYLVGVRTKARLFKKRQTAVCTLKNIPRKSDVVHVYITTSLPQTSPKPCRVFLVLQMV